MTYQPGQRVALEQTDDPYTRLRPGDQGTVRGYHPEQQILDVDWDSGSQLSMCLDAGDRIRTLEQPGPYEPAGDESRVDSHDGWRKVLDALRAAGGVAGCGAADWWAQDSVGGRASGDVAATAWRVLHGVDDGDPAVLDTLPTPDMSGQWSGTPGEGWYTAAAPHGASGWGDLTAEQQRIAMEAYRDGFDTAVNDRVIEACRAAASPTGDQRDLTHLPPRSPGTSPPGTGTRTASSPRSGLTAPGDAAPQPSQDAG